MIRRRWEDVPCDDARVDATARAVGVPPVIARLLCQRGLDDPEAAHRFLAPDLSQLHDPFLLTGMREAVERLLAAIARHERIAIHGDYDVDGVTSTVVLRRALELLGGEVIHFVPDRFRDGYGLQPATVDRLAAEGARLIVSVDCGIRATEAADRAHDLGIDLIITDHHEPERELPRALAVINPKRADCSYPDKTLAGVGVALKLVHGCCSPAAAASICCRTSSRWPQSARSPTSCRSSGRIGSSPAAASRASRAARTAPGSKPCCTRAACSGKVIDSYHVSFMVAPRLNAAGRMSSAESGARSALDEGARRRQPKPRARDGAHAGARKT